MYVFHQDRSRKRGGLLTCPLGSALGADPAKTGDRSEDEASPVGQQRPSKGVGTDVRFLPDRSRKTEKTGDRFERRGVACPHRCSSDGRLERDRSLADGRLKHQRTDRRIEHVFDLLTCPLWIRNWTDPESLRKGLKISKDETSPVSTVPTAAKHQAMGKGSSRSSNS